MKLTINEDTRLVTTELVGPDSTIIEGKAVVEPQFELLRKNEEGQMALFLRANTYKELHKGLLQAEEREEQNVEVSFSLRCYPLDGIVAINRALELVYGFTHAKERQTFFGPRPPRRLSIATGIDESIEVAYGEMAPPSWEGGSLSMYVNMDAPLVLGISGVVKRKFEPSIKEIVDTAKEYLKKNSIYRGQAVELDLSYIGSDEGFNPEHCAPRFIDVSEEIELILTRQNEKKLNRDVWNRMRHPDNFRKNRIAVKRGVLLSGKFGTGKSLTAYHTAQLAVKTGWTYFYLKSPQKFLVGYELAQLYSPSVFFVEDCDEVFGKRESSLQEALDGVTAKKAEVITVYTTNFPERIDNVFKRSGRIDDEIKFVAPDAEAAGRFIKMMGGAHLAPDVDFEAVGEAFADLVPSDIKNGLGLAITEAMGSHEDGADVTGKVTTDMLVLAGQDMREKARPIGDGKTQNDKDLEIVKHSFAILNPEGSDLKEGVAALKSDMAKVKKAVRA